MLRVGTVAFEDEGQGLERVALLLQRGVEALYGFRIKAAFPALENRHIHALPIQQ